MGSYTENLNLYKADPKTDGKQTFNIDTMLNENWEKIDKEIAEHVNDKDNPHDTTAADVGAATPEDLANYLPLTGGTIDGTFRFKRDTNKFISINVGSNGRFMVAQQDTGKIKRFVILDEDTLIPNIEDALKFGYNDGANHYFKIYGEHNVTAGTGELTAGTSSLYTGCIYLQYE